MMHVRFGRPNWDTVFPEMRLACAGHNIGACEMSTRAALTPCQAASKPPVCVVMLPAWCARFELGLSQPAPRHGD